MLSISALILKLQLRLTKPLVRFSGIEAARKGQDNLGKISTRLLQTKVDFTDVPFEHFKASWATPINCQSKDTHVILYLHGGGYTAGGLDYSKGFGGVLADETRLNILCVAYRLAPENKYPDAVDDAMTAYQYLLERGYQPEHIAFAGESAGGGLCYCLALRCKDEGIPLPGCILGISPWTDLSMSGKSYRNNVFRDPSLCRESLAYYVLVYAAGHETEPYVSPIFGHFAGFPPSQLFAGGDEILLDDSRTLFEKLQQSGCRASLHIEPGMWHVYPLYGTPEGQAAVKQMAIFLKKELGLLQ
ncbi:MAG: alpha/beta hydrolase [Clostridia bacterium]